MTEHDRYPIVFPFTHIGGIGMLVVQLLTGRGAIASSSTTPNARHRSSPSTASRSPRAARRCALLYLQHNAVIRRRRCSPTCASR